MPRRNMTDEAVMQAFQAARLLDAARWVVESGLEHCATEKLLGELAGRLAVAGIGDRLHSDISCPTGGQQMIDELISHFHLPSALAGLGLGSTAIAVVAWLINRWFAIRTKRADQTLEACVKLRTFLGKWFDAIAEAIVDGETPEKVREKLGHFMKGHSFEDELATITPILELDPACGRLLMHTREFRDDALTRKGFLYEALGPNKFYEDFPAHRAEALKALREPLMDCQCAVSSWRWLHSATSGLTRASERSVKDASRPTKSECVRRTGRRPLA